VTQRTCLRAPSPSACLCDSDNCNANINKEEFPEGETFASTVLPSSPSQLKDEINVDSQNNNNQRGLTTKSQPRRTTKAPQKDRVKEIPRARQDTTPGLQCFSCGSLLNAEKTCDQFDRSNVSHVQTCLTDEACLLYTWEKSSTETASLRECFPTRVLLGSIKNPLTPSYGCQMRDITDDGSGSIKACLCETDYCNDDDSADIPNNDYEEDNFEGNSLNSLVTKPEEDQTIDDIISSTKFLKPTPAPKANSRTTQKSYNCPQDFIELNDECFFISTEKTGWLQAKKRCEKKGKTGRLASLETEGKMSILLGLISKKLKRRDTSFWLAGNDIYEEGRWEWDGAEVISDDSYSLVARDWGWQDLAFSESDEENCLLWSVTFGFALGNKEGSWKASSCCKSLQYICQI